MKICPKHRLTETVDRRDLCMKKQRFLSLQILVIRICEQPFLDFQSDPLTHLCRRSSCKRHDQQTVNIHRMFPVRDLLQNTLYQNGCLSGTCRRADQKIPVSKPDDLLLFFCPQISHQKSPPSRKNSQISSESSSFSLR